MAGLEDVPMAGLEGVPIISEDVDLADLSESQLIHYVRQAKDAFSHYFPEGHEPLVQTDRALILLAKNVTDQVFESRFLPIKARYLLDENMDLYIRKVPGRCHGQVHSRVNADCVNWQDGQGLFDSFAVGDAVKSNYDGTKLEPDVAVFALSDGKNSTPRCIIEIEVNHRSPREARELAAVYFREPSVRSVVLLKVWNRRVDRTFAAACVVWAKGGDGNVGCHSAHDFGTAPIDAEARNNLSGANENEPAPLTVPTVPAGMAYTTPQPGRAIAGHAPQIVNIPASLLIVNATNEHGEQLMGLNPPIENLQLNLSVYLRVIERSLEE